MKKIIFTACIVLFCAMQSIAQDVSRQDPSKPQSFSEQIEDVSNKIQNIQQQYDNLKKWGVLSICGALGIIFIVSVIISKKAKGRDEIVEIVLSSHRIKEALAPHKNHQTQNMARTIQLTEGEINLIVDRVLECLELNKKEKKPLLQPLEHNATFTPPKIAYKFLKGKTGKTFSRVENTPEDSYFRLSNESGDTADFEFFGNDEEAIAKRIFHEDICEILTGSYQNARIVKMIMPGKVKRIGEQWAVIERIKIILT